MKEKMKYFAIIVVIIATCTGCKNLRKVYWDYDCVWYSENPYIYMPAGGNKAVLEINGTKYNCSTEAEPGGVGINFYVEGTNDEDIYLWITECKVKNEKLYLTIVEDNISDYEGKTIELIQIPDNETE